ncbi:hypothetical protein FACS189465_0560 [Clostridia bacterium]|nr:hypothetical protein FACS189465_0560 [Clostridia bacterium]
MSTINEKFVKLFSENLLNVGYKNYSEYLKDELKRTEMLLGFYYTCIAENKKNNIQSSMEKSVIFSKHESYVRNSYKVAGRHIASRLQNTNCNKVFIAAEYVKKCYEFDDLSWFCVLVGILDRNEKKIEKFFKEQYDAEFKLSFEFLIKCYYFVGNVLDIEHYPNTENTLSRKMNALCFDKNDFIIDERLYSFIMNNATNENTSKGLKIFYYDRDKNEKLIVREKSAEKIYSLISNKKLIDLELYFYLYGQEGMGKKTIAKRAAELAGKSLICLNLKECDFSSENALYNSFISAFREAFLHQGYLCIENFDVLEKADKSDQTDYPKYIRFILNSARRYSRVVFVLSNKNMNFSEYNEDLLWLDIPVNELSKIESIKVWRNYLKEFSELSKNEVIETANKFSFTCGQIAKTARKLKRLKIWNSFTDVTKKDLSECAYAQVINTLSDKATLIQAKYDWNDLILNEREKIMLKNACAQVQYKHIVYDKWGMNKRILYGKGLSMLFEGPSGTGKTMAAQVIAKELELQIYKVDLSQIVSKYIGETEKNLNNIFDEAKKSNVILLFDETDALFGKRTEVKDSHDKNANIETSYLLQKMEEYDGITIMTTNFPENIDKAFFRRISYVIHFAFPDAQARKEIWQKIFPKEVPLSKKINFDYLSNQFEISGGSIKNIVLVAAFLAAFEKSKSITFKQILTAIKFELKKHGKMLLKNDFGEYGYLLD